MGQERKTLSGFSSKATVSHAGLLLSCDVVQVAPPYLRTKALRVVAAKVLLLVLMLFLYCCWCLCRDVAVCFVNLVAVCGCCCRGCFLVLLSLAVAAARPYVYHHLRGRCSWAYGVHESFSCNLSNG